MNISETPTPPTVSLEPMPDSGLSVFEALVVWLLGWEGHEMDRETRLSRGTRGGGEGGVKTRARPEGLVLGLARTSGWRRVSLWGLERRWGSAQ